MYSKGRSKLSCLYVVVKYLHEIYLTLLCERLKSRSSIEHSATSDENVIIVNKLVIVKKMILNCSFFNCYLMEICMFFTS